MSKLGIKPIEAGISVNLAVADGLLLHDNDLRINLLDYTNALAKCLSESFALAAETGYVTPENIESLLTRAHKNSIALAMESGYITDSTIGQSLAQCTANALALQTELTKKGFKLE
jgi:large subunit ribosomal protein L10